jgi:hypothetical protein
MRSIERLAITIAITIAFAACARPHGPPAPWPVHDGWRREVIPFPLDFAPALAHRGFEELRFAPGFFDPARGGYWSYAFAWRTDDRAELDAATLAGELTAYFRGLVAAVDDKHRVSTPEQIVVHATPTGGGFTLAAHVFDAFGTAAPLDLSGTATRRACGDGALWVFVLAPSASSMRAELDALAAAARCDNVRR